MSFYKNIENIKFSIFLRRGYNKKSKGSQKGISYGGVRFGSSSISFSFGCFAYSGVRGGGKCPDEEHST
jgi:hypothetical protein